MVGRKMLVFILWGGSERPLEHARSRVPWKGHGLGGRRTAVELFGFPTLSKAGIYQMGSETNF